MGLACPAGEVRAPGLLDSKLIKGRKDMERKEEAGRGGRGRERERCRERRKSVFRPRLLLCHLQRKLRSEVKVSKVSPVPGLLCPFLAG